MNEPVTSAHAGFRDRSGALVLFYRSPHVKATCEPKSWWIVFVTSAVGTVSATLTFARVDLVEMYRLMGYSAEELAQIQPFLGVFGRVLFPLIAANALLWLGYLLYLKKHFRHG